MDLLTEVYEIGTVNYFGVCQKTVASPGRGILAIDESNATCGKRLDSIGLENTETNRQAYRQLLLTTPGLGEYISGSILFEETLYQEAAWGLARYAAISQDNGLVPIVEPEILLDGDHPIERTLEVAERVWAEVFYYLAENNVLFEGILLKPSMVTPGAEHKEKASPETIAKYTLTMLKRRVPPAVPGIMV
nr:fructose-bisphosphate aldolase, class I [Ipomoea batatas]